MIGAGVGFPTCEDYTDLTRIYVDFANQYSLATLVQADEEARISKRQGDNWSSYSRQYQAADGKWVTVQVWGKKMLLGFFDVRLLKVFGEHGEKLAQISNTTCATGKLVLSEKDVGHGKDLVVASALKAVTGKDFEIVIDRGVYE